MTLILCRAFVFSKNLHITSDRVVDADYCYEVSMCPPPVGILVNGNCRPLHAITLSRMNSSFNEHIPAYTIMSLFVWNLNPHSKVQVWTHGCVGRFGIRDLY